MYILNENNDPEVPGDMAIFFDPTEALRSLEPWYAQEAHLIVDDVGREYRLRDDRGLVLDKVGTGRTSKFHEFLRYFIREDGELNALLVNRDVTSCTVAEVKMALGDIKNLRGIRPKRR